MRLSSNDYIKEREAMENQDEIVDIKYSYARLNKIKKIKPNFYEEIKEGKAIGIFKERYIKIMLEKDKEKAMKEFDLLKKEMENYVSMIRKNGKSQKRNWTISNKYRTNYKSSF